MTASSAEMCFLQCVVQTYDWGKPGMTSAVARIHAASRAMPIIDDTIPYAEFWMGTHPNGASIQIGEDGPNGGTLESFNDGAQLPFLFKILSVGKALSIQAHPDKSLSRTLHECHPEVYKDSNHKPEMAIAMTQFEAMCGFRPLNEISIFISLVPELRELIGNEICTAFQDAVSSGSSEAGKQQLRVVFTSLLMQDNRLITHKLNELLLRLEHDSLPTFSESFSNADLRSLIYRLAAQFPGDIGVFCVFFLNTLLLSPGDALYLAANEPHAYLSGDILECMACSDNVVRAGLTPKLRDIDTLVNMLTYKTSRPCQFQANSLDDFTSAYSPPIDEFYLTITKLPAKMKLKYQLDGVNGTSIVLCYSGQGLINGLTIAFGSVIALKSNINAVFQNTGIDTLIVFRCSKKP